MPDTTLPTNLTDGGQFRWDIQSDGSISDGTNDAYDGGLYLSGFPQFQNAQTEDAGREVVIGTATINGLEVQRKIFVPEDQSWARYLEVFTNPTDATISYDVVLDTDLGSNGDTQIIETSNGDQSFNTNDTWIVTDDFSDGGEDPTMLHVVAGVNGEIRPSDAYLSYDYIQIRYNLTLQTGETRSIMHFAVQSPDRQTALDKADALAKLQLDATLPKATLSALNPASRS